MFTGIIETTGVIRKIVPKQNYLILTVAHAFPADDIKIGESIACDGICLTVISADKQQFIVEVSQETLSRTMAANYRERSIINLELALRAGDRFGGHYVTGHVDDTGSIDEIKTVGQSIILRIIFEMKYTNYVIDKGSITINGVSLTLNEVGPNWCSINLIPYTLEHTNLSKLQLNDKVNMEFDIIGKYAAKAAMTKPESRLSFAKLSESGW